MSGRGVPHAGRPGLLFAVLATLAAAACADGAPPRDVVQLESGQHQLPEGSRRHDVHLEGVGAADEVTPAAVEARAGDAVAFVAGDAVTHSVAFLAERLDSSQVAFLETRGQLRSPPLLERGSTWVVTLEDAPAGDYAFSCTLHGGQGVIRVAPRD